MKRLPQKMCYFLNDEICRWYNVQRLYNISENIFYIFYFNSCNYNRYCTIIIDVSFFIILLLLNYGI
jgi:hypothetical protein